MWKAAQNALRGITDLVYPPVCLVCGTVEELYCSTCRAAVLPAVPPPPEGTVAARCVGLHQGPLREAVVLLKYERKTALARQLGEMLAEVLRPLVPAWAPRVLVPVPVHWKRELWRGFNQSALLAEHAARQVGIPVAEALRRTRPTRTQVGLTAAQRAANLRGAFRVTRRGAVYGGTVVLVDDVYTTGSTLAECASVLLAAGAAHVYAVTVTWEPP